MKKVVFLVVLAVAGAFAYNQFNESKVGTGNLTPEQQQVRSIEDRIDTAGRQISQAGRTAGLSGLDSTSDVEAALRELERIESDVQAIKRKTDSEEIRQECTRLLRKVESVRR